MAIVSVRVVLVVVGKTRPLACANQRHRTFFSRSPLGTSPLFSSTLTDPDLTSVTSVDGHQPQTLISLPHVTSSDKLELADVTERKRFPRTRLTNHRTVYSLPSTLKMSVHCASRDNFIYCVSRNSLLLVQGIFAERLNFTTDDPRDRLTKRLIGMNDLRARKCLQRRKLLASNEREERTLVPSPLRNTRRRHYYSDVTTHLSHLSSRTLCCPCSPSREDTRHLSHEVVNWASTSSLTLSTPINQSPYRRNLGGYPYKSL